MATIELGEPPALPAGSAYGAYKPWLERAFHFRLCSYCLLRSRTLHVDHYEPRKLAPHRIDDPTNLLLACPACNGRAGKSDYHPRHLLRTRLPADRTEHLVIDVRRDDFEELFELDSQGTVRPRGGLQEDRAIWNIALLSLDRQDCNRVRASTLEVLRLAERVSTVLETGGAGHLEGDLRDVLETYVLALAENLPFLRAFGLELSPRLRARVLVAREALV